MNLKDSTILLPVVSTWNYSRELEICGEVRVGGSMNQAGGLLEFSAIGK